MTQQNADAAGKIDRGHQPADAVFDEGEWPSRRPPHNAAGGVAGGEDDGASGGRARERWRAGIRASLMMVGARRMRRRWRLSLLATVIHSWAEGDMTVVEKRVAKAKIDHGMDLGSMKLREIPVAVTECSPKVLCEVKRVSFEENRLVHLPRNFFELLGGAVSMMLYKNQLCYIPTDIGRLKHLNMLILSNNNLQILPPSIGDLTSLSIFHVNGNPRLRRLPLEFGKLSHTSAGGHLKEVQYDVERITYPPAIIFDNGLPAVLELMNRMFEATLSRKLVLSGLGLEEIPDYVCEIPLRTAITELNLLQNDIKRLIPDIGLLTNLEVLRIDENTVTFPSQAIMKQSAPLRDAETRMLMNASRAPFIGFLRRIADATRTRDLVLQGGQWAYKGTLEGNYSLMIMAPEVIRSATSCKLLDLCFNEIKEIPATIEKCTALTALRLRKNRVRYVPEGISRVTTLRVLDLGDNDLFALPPETFEGMVRLVDCDLSGNHLKELPSSLGECTGLTRLYISSNGLSEIPASLSSLRRLRYLGLGANPFGFIPPQLGASPYLTEVNGDGLKVESICPGVVNQPTPPKNPVQEDGGHPPARFACPSQRTAALVAKEWTCVEGLHLASLSQPESVKALPPSLQPAVTAFMEPTELSVFEAGCLTDRRFISYEPADTVYSRKWKLSKEAQLRGLDPIGVNQGVAAGMPTFWRAPGLTRYMWGIWGGWSLGVCDVAGVGMCSIREDLIRLEWLVKLRVSYNRITTLPPEISRLTQLTTLDFSHNMMCNISPVIGTLTTLREIDLSYNMLDSLPKEMAKLSNWTFPRDPQAKHLYDISWASGNPMSFPHPMVLQLGPSQTRAFLRQVALSEESGNLEFDHRGLPLFPDQLTDFGFLVSLDLSNNKIDRVPPSITNMVQLKSFILAGNSIDRLPARLSTLTSLELLDMRDNQLVAIPDTIGFLHARLRRIMLGRNRLVALPSSMGLLSNLESLLLNWNKLETLPEETGNCTALTELQLSFNHLKQVPSTFSNLTALTTCALQNNHISLLPTVLGNMPGLTNLAFSHNHWQMPQPEVLHWPDEYKEAEEKKRSVGMKVWCRTQRFGRFRPARIDQDYGDGTYDVSFPYDRDAQGGIDRESAVPHSLQMEEPPAPPHIIIKPLTDHQRLVDFMNRFHASAKSKELDLSGFHITEFLDYDAGYGFKYCTTSGWYTRGLRRLDLSCNLLSTVPLSISRLSCLTVLNLSKNVIVALPETISSLVSLKTVDLSENYLTVLPCGLGMASELEQILVRQNPILAPPIEILRREASVVVKYLYGVHVARKTKRLDWNGLGLMSLDSLVVMLPDGDAALVEELYLDDNLLVNLHPSVLYELQNLQVLRCCRNYLVSVHPSLGQFCGHLEQLTLDGNCFSTVPHELGTLTKLVSVSFDSNPHLVSPPPEINEQPSLVKIKYLKQLHAAHDQGVAILSDLELQAFPIAFCDAWALVKLDLSRNFLPSIPYGIGMLRKLKWLSLETNRLQSIEPNLAMCTCLEELYLNNNSIRRIPPELGRLTRLTVLQIENQATDPSLDTMGGTQGYEWSAYPTLVRHVHNASVLVEDGGVKAAEGGGGGEGDVGAAWETGPEESRSPCAACIVNGRLDGGSFPSDSIIKLLDEHTRNERERAAKGEPSRPEPFMRCRVCGEEQKVSNMQGHPELRVERIREWLPNLYYHRDTWHPHLPHSAFQGSYRRTLPGSQCTDSRPEPDLIESPPMELLTLKPRDEERPGVKNVINYLERCLAARSKGVLDVKGFSLPQFPLEALDLSWLKECRVSNNDIADLPSDLDRLTHLVTLNMDNNNLTILSPGLRFLTALEVLSIADNHLVEVCPEIGACTNLRSLILSGNPLCTLPHTIGSCTLLAELYLEGCEIRVLPPSLSLAKGMHTLVVDQDPDTNAYWSPPNPIPSQGTSNLMRYLTEVYNYATSLRLMTPGYDLEKVPDIYLEAATSITALNLDENNITELPDEIGGFKLLSELFSICDNQLLSLPASVGNLVLLQRLRLSGNKLTSLPDTVSALTNLELLTVDHNRITDIPRAYSTLTRLTELTFTDNDVRKIHPEMGLISSITSLGLQDNPLVVPSNEICARSTAEVVDFLGRIKISQLTGCLDLAALDLTTLVHQLHEATSARVVLFQNNNLTKLPEEIEKLSRIQELILDNNPINSLPDQIGKLATLQILSIDKMIGGMQKLPVTMEALYSLVVFKASDNGITVLPNCFKYLKSLAYVDLNNNKLMSLPSTFCNCESLEVLLLENNELEELCKGMSAFEQMHTISLKNNRLTRLSRGLGSLMLVHNLKSYDLSGNPWSMPTEEVREQGEARMLEFVGEIWKSKLANGLNSIGFGLLQVPDEILAMHGIVELYLDNNKLETLPKEISDLSKLEEFSAKNNRLTTLCDELFEIKGLSVLKVDSNKLTLLNRNVGKIARTLTWLGIEHNMIKNFPPEFALLEALEILNVTFVTLDPDISWALDAGLQVLKAYVRAWNMVPSINKLNLTWNSTIDWEPLPKVPYQLWKYTETITHVVLDFNEIEEIPHRMCTMKKLRVLSLENNKITSVPYALCLLTTLEELRLKDNNELFDPPYPMVEDPQLGFKAIMKYLEAMHLAASLGSLVLSNMKLSYFKPNEIRETTLAKLHWRLARAESKTSDHAIRSPEEAEQIRRRLQIKNLETLSLDSNEFEIIPQEIFFFSSLTHLSLANNMLMDLPPEIGRLTSLTVLAVDDNKLESLPSQMSKLFRIKKITFSNNNLEFIPEVIMEMTRLQILTLSNNRIEKLPDELPPCLPYLRVLSLNKNRLTSVPPTIASLRHIVAMHLADNDIITLPPTISACNQLKAVYLSNNPLPHVPLGLLALHSLEQLRMSGTFVTGLPVELGLLTALKDLRLDNTERLIWPSREIVDEGLEKLQEYLLDHYDLTTMDVIEDDESAYDMLDQAPVTRDSLLAHIDKVQEILEEVQLCHQQISALKKMRVKQVRIGNKTNIEDIDNQVAEITERMQWFTADVVQLEEMRNVETDIMLVQAELDQLELEWG